MADSNLGQENGSILFGIVCILNTNWKMFVKLEYEKNQSWWILLFGRPKYNIINFVLTEMNYKYSLVFWYFIVQFKAKDGVIEWSTRS